MNETSASYSIARNSNAFRDVIKEVGLAFDRRLEVVDRGLHTRNMHFLDYLTGSGLLLGEHVVTEQSEYYRLETSARPLNIQVQSDDTGQFLFGKDIFANELGELAAAIDLYNVSNPEKFVAVSSESVKNAVIVNDFLEPEQRSLQVSALIIEHQLEEASMDKSCLGLFVDLTTEDSAEFVEIGYADFLADLG